MRKFFIIAFGLILSVALVACGGGKADDAKSEDKVWEEVSEKGELVIGTSGTLIGSSIYAGEDETIDELTGFDVEVILEVAKRLDLEPKFEIMAMDDMLTAIDSGRIDVAANDIEMTDKRKEKFGFSEPYKFSFSTIVVRKDDNSGIESLEDLKDKKVGGSATTIYSQIAEHYGATVYPYGNAGNESYLRDVDNGRTDAVVNDYYLCKFGVEAFPDFDIHLHPTLKFNPTKTGVVMPKDAPELKKNIDRVLDEMHEDGTISDLAIEFYEEDVSVESDEEYEEIEGLEL